MIARAFGVLVFISSSTALAASDVLQPSGKWIVNFADAKCVATRNYGSEQDPLYLVLKSPATGDVLQIAVVKKSAKGDDAWQLDGDISFDDGPPIEANVLRFDVKQLRQQALMMNLPRSSLAAMGQATSVRMRVRDPGIAKLGTRLGVGATSAEYSFAVTQMSALLKTLDACTADLRNVWKVWRDDGGGAGLKEGPSGDLRRLFSPDDYPGIAEFKDQDGTVAMVLLIDEQGKVADCMVTQTSGVASLDAQSCAVIKARGKFKPAIGLDGKPAKSSWFQRITWRLTG